jgi:hypothetical protein
MAAPTMHSMDFHAAMVRRRTSIARSARPNDRTEFTPNYRASTCTTAGRRWCWSISRQAWHDDCRATRRITDEGGPRAR